MGYTAIFGGTFNPPHIGHYEMLSALEKCPQIEEIWLMPDKIPPHKVCDFLACDKDRIERCRIVAEDFKKARLCLAEFEREGKSYTYDTVSFLKTRYPQTDFAFVCGGDMLVYFPKWYKSDFLMRMLPFIVFRRCATDSDEFDKCVDLFGKKGMQILLKDDFIPKVSSTEIREDFKNCRKLLPPKIYEYLTERGVYSE